MQLTFNRLIQSAGDEPTELQVPCTFLSENIATVYPAPYGDDLTVVELKSGHGLLICCGVEQVKAKWKEAIQHDVDKDMTRFLRSQPKTSQYVTNDGKVAPLLFPMAEEDIELIKNTHGPTHPVVQHYEERCTATSDCECEQCRLYR